MSSRNGVGPQRRPNLFGMDRGQIRELLAGYDVPGFHAAQIYRWLYAQQQHDPEQWTDLGKPLRARLASEAHVATGEVTDRAEAPDGTVKYRVRLTGGGDVECVYMMQSGRVTLCVSSQVGCALDCDFCLTGKMGFGRHLSVGEIVGQVALIQQDRPPAERPPNIVFMGMGEPMHNYDAVMAAVRLFNDDDGFGISRHRITVSTSGMAPAIEKLATEKVRPRLAVSLNATTDAVRDRLMPINRKYDLRRLLDACRSFATSTGDRFTFEYVLLAGVNDNDADVRRLRGLVKSLPAKLNLIPFNPVPGLLEYRPPLRSRILAIRDALLDDDVPVSIRWSRGGDARAACGQLALLDPETGAPIPARSPARSKHDRPVG